ALEKDLETARAEHARRESERRDAEEATRRQVEEAERELATARADRIRLREEVGELRTQLAAAAEARAEADRLTQQLEAERADRRGAAPAPADPPRARGEEREQTLAAAHQTQEEERLGLTRAFKAARAAWEAERGTPRPAEGKEPSSRRGPAAAPAAVPAGDD